MTRPLFLPLVATLALGCGLDFSAPLLDTEASLHVSLDLVDSLPVGEARLGGFLSPGLSATGSVRFLVDSSLEVLGNEIAPFTGTVSGEPLGIPYSERWAINPDVPPGVVELRAPDIPEIGGPGPVVRVTPPWRVGPAEVTVAPGSALRLDLTAVPAPGDSAYQNWRLDLVKDGQTVGQINAIGPIPAALEVPWAVLAGLGSGGQAVLTAYQWAGNAAGGGRYSVTLQVVTKHFWFVTVQP